MAISAAFAQETADVYGRDNPALAEAHDTINGMSWYLERIPELIGALILLVAVIVFVFVFLRRR